MKYVACFFFCLGMLFIILNGISLVITPSWWGVVGILAGIFLVVETFGY